MLISARILRRFLETKRDLIYSYSSERPSANAYGKKKLLRLNRTNKSRKIITLGEKETYKYKGLLKADSFKKAEMK